MYLQKQLMLLTVAGLSQQLSGVILSYVTYSSDAICTVRVKNDLTWKMSSVIEFCVCVCSLGSACYTCLLHIEHVIV